MPTHSVLGGLAPGSGPEVQQTQCWPDRATGLERGSACTDTSSPYNTHTFAGLPNPKDGAEATWLEEDIRMGLEKAVQLPWAATG